MQPGLARRRHRSAHRPCTCAEANANADTFRAQRREVCFGLLPTLLASALTSRLPACNFVGANAAVADTNRAAANTALWATKTSSQITAYQALVGRRRTVLT